jgi:clan AA aspartic protease
VISGIVTDLHAIVSVVFLLPNGSRFPIQFVVDTGFTGALCLPREAISLMGLPFVYERSANLADNSSISLPMHDAVILWNGEERDVYVLGTGTRPLLGTELLNGYEMTIQFTEEGLVTIDAM